MYVDVDSNISQSPVLPMKFFLRLICGVCCILATASIQRGITLPWEPKSFEGLGV